MIAVESESSLVELVGVARQINQWKTVASDKDQELLVNHLSRLLRNCSCTQQNPIAILESFEEIARAAYQAYGDEGAYEFRHFVDTELGVRGLQQFLDIHPRWRLAISRSNHQMILVPPRSISPNKVVKVRTRQLSVGHALF